ncbi:MAG: hypothetical protein QNJ97_15080 [Myxococcota bacterium]|nr:hypothetical protein [Myxococcota bacterium]
MPKNALLPEYEPPKIIEYTSEQILEEIGPAQACSPDPCPLPSPEAWERWKEYKETD